MAQHEADVRRVSDFRFPGTLNCCIYNCELTNHNLDLQLGSLLWPGPSLTRNSILAAVRKGTTNKQYRVGLWHWQKMIKRRKINSVLLYYSCRSGIWKRMGPLQHWASLLGFKLGGGDCLKRKILSSLIIGHELIGGKWQHIWPLNLRNRSCQFHVHIFFGPAVLFLEMYCKIIVIKKILI